MGCVFMGKHYLRAPTIVIKVYGSHSGKRISVGKHIVYFESWTDKQEINEIFFRK